MDLEKKIDEAAADNEIIKEKKLKDDKEKASATTIDVDELPDKNAAPATTPAKPNKHSYFDNALGKFFIDIGFNLVQEFVQTDLLKQQKRKRDREMSNNSKTNYAIQALLKNLEYTKENNEPYKMPQKKCEFCSFKTESDLVLGEFVLCVFFVFNVFNFWSIM